MLLDRINTVLNVSVAAILVGVAGYYCNDFVNNFDKMSDGVGAATIFGAAMAVIIGGGLLVVNGRKA